MFEPNQEAVGSCGLSVFECLVTAEEGKATLPIENFQEFTVYLDAGEEMVHYDHWTPLYHAVRTLLTSSRVLL